MDFPSTEFLAMIQALWMFAAACILAVALVVVLRRRWQLAAVLFPACALAVTGVSGNLWEGAPVSREVSSDASLTIASINMKEARGSTKDVAAVVRDNNVDIVVVLEADKMLVADLQGRPGMEDFKYSSGPARGSTVGGSVILSRLPLTSSSEDVGPVSPGDLQQPAVFLTVGGRTKVAVFGAHPLPPLPGLAGTWARELESLSIAAKKARSNGYRTIIAGDFNATRDHPAFRKLLADGVEVSKSWGISRSWPSEFPLLALDHVVAHGFDVSGRGKFDVQGSDHRGLWVRVYTPTNKIPASKGLLPNRG